MNLRSKISTGLCVSALLMACTQKPSAQPAEKAGSSTSAVKASNSPVTTGALVDGETYQVLLPQRAGEPLKVQPKIGYKVNKDFPHRFVLKGTSDLEVKGEHTEALLSFSFTGESSCPDKQCKGTADFSICNDQMCKLYRGVDIAWSAP